MQATNRSGEQTPRKPDHVARRLATYANKIVPFATASKLILLFLLALNTRFVMDEFVQLGHAKYLGHGFFTTIWPVKAVGYAVFYEFAHLLGRDATSILLIGRVQTAVLGCAIVGMIYACSRSLAATKAQALLVVLVLLSFSNFIERIFRTRSEPLAVFFAVAALLVILRGSSPTAKRAFFAGILSGLAFVTTQKSIYFNVALGLGLMVDAASSRRFLLAFRRGAWLVIGWTIPLIAYCLAFGGADPLPVVKNLFFGPADLVSAVPATYTGLRAYVWQTLIRNALLYLLCFSALAIEIARFPSIPSQRRIALVFSITITALVFMHNQPWPYVFVMALPFVALWIPALMDRVPANRRHAFLVGAALTLAIIMSFAKNFDYFRLGNSEQFAIIQKAEGLISPDERYFDGVGMIPNRREPSTLWLDRPLVLRTLSEGKRSEAYRIFSENPPKIVIWSYRMDAIEPVVGPLIRANYVHVAPNIWMAGRRLKLGQSEDFRAPTSGSYRLYDSTGKGLSGSVEVDGKALSVPFQLAAGHHRVALLQGLPEALLLPEGDYAGQFVSGGDDAELFAGVYE